jgi:hypothetical protein
VLDQVDNLIWMHQHMHDLLGLERSGQKAPDTERYSKSLKACKLIGKLENEEIIEMLGMELPPKRSYADGKTHAFFEPRERLGGRTGTLCPMVFDRDLYLTSTGELGASLRINSPDSSCSSVLAVCIRLSPSGRPRKRSSLAGGLGAFRSSLDHLRSASSHCLGVDNLRCRRHDLRGRKVGRRPAPRRPNETRAQ